MKPTVTDLFILRTYNVCGSMTIADLLKVRLDLGPHKDIQLACERLYANSYLNAQRFPGMPPIFEIASKGKRYIDRTAEKQMGEMPEPRAPQEFKPLVIKPILTRPGADDHLQCHSRRGESLVPHRPPITLGVA
jgi:hypothetical protein